MKRVCEFIKKGGLHCGIDWFDQSASYETPGSVNCLERQSSVLATQIRLDGLEFVGIDRQYSEL